MSSKSKAEYNNETHFVCVSCNTAKVRDGYLGATIERADGCIEVCEYCLYTKYKKCKSCTTWHHSMDMVHIDEKQFCGECSKDAVFTCGYCERQRDIENIFMRNTIDGTICYGCSREWEAETNPAPIAYHSFKPRARMQGKAKSGLFYGIELEVDSYKKAYKDFREPTSAELRDGMAARDKNSANNIALAKDLRAKMPFIYCKSDGSVPAGFEIVTHPMSYHWLSTNREKFGPIFELNKSGMVSHDGGRCGMHIHMSKAAFGKLQLYKFITFFQENQDFILLISQRGSMKWLNQWAKISYEPSGDEYSGPYDEGESIYDLAKGECSNSVRYKAINLQNEKTVEIRIFRGTLKRERFFKNIEFCQALFEFTALVSVPQCTLENFLKYVTTYKSEFSNLFMFIEENYKVRFIPGRKKPQYKFEVTKEVHKEISDDDWTAHVEEIKSKKDAEIAKRIEAAQARKKGVFQCV